MAKITVDPREQEVHGLLLIAAAAAIVGPQGQRPWREYARLLARKMDTVDGHLLAVAGDFLRTVRANAVEIVDVLDQHGGSGGGVLCWREDGDGPYRGSPEGWKHKAHTFFPDSPVGGMILEDARAVMAAGASCQVIIGYEHPGQWQGPSGETPDALKKVVALRFDRRAVAGNRASGAEESQPSEPVEQAPRALAPVVRVDVHGNVLRDRPAGQPAAGTPPLADAGRVERATAWYLGLDDDGKRRAKAVLRGRKFAGLDDEGWKELARLRADLAAPTQPAPQPSEAPSLGAILDFAKGRVGADVDAILDCDCRAMWDRFWMSLTADLEAGIERENAKTRAPVEIACAPVTFGDLRSLVGSYHRADVARQMAEITGAPPDRPRTTQPEGALRWRQ